MFCAKCGAALSETAAFCTGCGTPVALPAGEPAASASAFASVVVPAGGLPLPPAVAPGIGTAPRRYAGFWLRAAAYMVDGFLLSLVTTPLLLASIWPALRRFPQQAAALGNNPPPDRVMQLVAPFFARFILLSLVFSILQWLYYAICESSAWQATLGKKILDLRVTDLDSRRIGFGRATGRVFAMLALNLVPFGFIGFILAGFTERKQALHDIIAGCLVLRG